MSDVGGALRVAVLGAFAAFLPAAFASTQGLATVSGGVSIVRPAPALFLAEGEAFVPSAPSAGIQWLGRLSVLRAGEYRFYATGGSLRLDGREAAGEPMRLGAGEHEIEFVAPRPEGAKRILAEWEGPGFQREPIPSTLLSAETAALSHTEGRALFEDLGCSNCHLSDSQSIQRRPGPVLTGLGARRKKEWIRHWLDEPERFRPWATMPQMLSPTDRADVASYLAEQGERADSPVPRIRTRHIERGRSTFQTFGCAACHSLDIPLRGLGSKMAVGHLQEYLLDPIRYSPDGRMPSFHLDNLEALELAAYLTQSRDEAFEEPTPEGDARRGKELVRESGCLACHRLDGLEPANEAPSLARLDEDKGCLADSPPGHLPRYRLGAGQRQALRAFVARYRSEPDVAAAPTFDLPRRLEQLRCSACHELDGEGPSGALAEEAPPLSGVGDKLRPEWIERSIGSGTSMLDWQELRMPSFGPEHASWLAGAFAKASGIDPAQPDSASIAGSASEGRDRLGVDSSQGGMGCIGCHGWGEFPSLGENGPTLSEAGLRLRPEWFRRWMRDPARILPGTSMPSYFGGTETEEFLDFIGDVWAAFRDASVLDPPFGFRTSDASASGEAVPVPTERAVVVRWDMPDATPASINVGLPGGISYCFDAGESRLRYAWRGGFIDLTRTLLTKKNPETNLTEVAEIVGEIFFREGPYPIRMGEDRRIPQRRFRGYRLVDSIPEFHYEVDGVGVFERIEAAGSGILRRFRIKQVDQLMWFEPVEGDGTSVRTTLEGNRIPHGENVSFEVTVTPSPR